MKGILHSFSSDAESRQKERMLGGQLVQIVRLIIAGLGLLAIEYFFPNFFNYPYLKWSVQLEDVTRFWPLLIWGALLALIHAFSRYATSRDYELFALGAVTSVLAGVWEELGYRCVFIAYAMIGILATNWVFSTGFFVALLVVAIVGALYLIVEVKEKILQAIGLTLCALGLWFAWVYARNFEILIWIYDILITVADWMTFKQMSGVLFGTHEHLFILGAFLANIWFRDGHKYQGPFGLVNSWYAGMVLLYATLTYGLLTAIVIHALYDLIFDVTLLLRRRLVRV